MAGKQKKPVHFVTYYPHVAGNMTTHVELTRKEFEDILTVCGGQHGASYSFGKYNAKKRAHVPPKDAKYNDDLWEGMELFLETRTGGEHLWGFNELSNYEPKELRKAIKRGAWVGEWEEGSFALGTDLPKVKRAIIRQERKIAADCGEDEAEFEMDDF